MQNYDCYRMVQQNHNTAKRIRKMEHDRDLFRTAKAIEIASTMFAVFYALHLIEGMGV